MDHGTPVQMYPESRCTRHETLSSLERLYNFALTGCIAADAVLSSHFAFPLNSRVFSEPMKAITATALGAEGNTTTPEVMANVAENLARAKRLLPSLQSRASTTARAKTFNTFTTALVGDRNSSGVLNVERIPCTNELQVTIEKLAEKMSTTLQPTSGAAAADDYGEPVLHYSEDD